MLCASRCTRCLATVSSQSNPSIRSRDGLASSRIGRAPQRPRQFRRRAAAAAAAAAAGARWQRQPRPENQEGSFYVDHTCIDCDTCRWMAPASFSRVGDMSAVTAQPQTREERHQAMQALLSCPTYSIHCRDRHPGELRAAQESFPLAVPGCPDVYYTGFAAESSFGATAYFIRRPQGNILVDVPRWSPRLAQRLQRMGGVRWIFLTHRDDVGDHAAWAEHTGAARIIHRLEARARQGTDKCEVQLEGEGPWHLPGEAGSSGGGGGDPDVQLLFTPGHTSGCVSLLYRPNRALFTGDHLAWSHRLQRLTIFRAYNWHSVPQQLDSVAALRHADYVHVLPGHGRRAAFADAAERERCIEELLAAEGYAGSGAVV